MATLHHQTLIPRWHDFSIFHRILFTQNFYSMENHMILDEKAKTRIGIICFIPVVCFLVCFIYYLILLLPLTEGHHAPASIVGITSTNYSTLLILLASSAIITAPVFIYCLVLLARIKTLNSEHKLLWFIFLCIMAPIASALFWLFHIKDAATHTPIYPDIA